MGKNILCAECGKNVEECKCQLLICHTHEAAHGFGRFRVVENPDRPQTRFRQMHRECGGPVNEASKS